MSKLRECLIPDTGKTYIYVALVLSIFIAAIYLRLYNFNQGIHQNDSIQYWITAKKWLDGQIVFTDGPLHIEFFRPSLYYFHSLALKVFGVNDYAIKVFTGLSDVMTLMVLFFSGRIIFTSRWVALAPLLLYGFLPKVIHYSRMEIAHIPSGLFTSLSFLFFVLYERQYTRHKLGSLLLLTACGVSISIAATMHEDLGAIWAGYCFVLLVDLVFTRISKDTVIKYLLSTFSLTTGFLSLFIAFGCFIGFGRILSMMSGESGLIVDSTRFPMSYSLGLLTGAFAYIATIPLQVLYYISAAIALYAILLRKDGVKQYTYAPFIIFVIYIVVLDIVMDRANYMQHARLLIPLLPISAIATVYWIYYIISFFSGRIAVIAVLSISIFVPAVAISSNYVSLKWQILHVKEQKRIFNTMKDRIDEEHRLLIAPTSLFPGQRVLSLEMYLDGNAMYTIDFNDKGKTLQEYVDQLNIKYVLLPKRQKIDKFSLYYRMITNAPLGEDTSGGMRLPYMRCSLSAPLDCWTEAFNPGAYIGLTENEYTPQTEMDYLLEFIKEHERGTIFEDKNITIVELK